MKKRPFLLLELLIAIGLVSLAAVPLLSKPLLYLKEELKTLREVELQWHASTAFIATKAELSQNKIPWDLLSSGTKRAIGQPKDLTLLSKGTVKETIFVKAVPKMEAHDTMSEVRLIEITASYLPVKQSKAKEISFSTKVCVRRASSDSS